MKKNNIISLIIILTCIVLINIGCKKYLDVKPSASLAIPKKPGDLQALLDYYDKLNYRGMSVTSISSDDYFISAVDYNSVAENLKRIYTWQKDNLFPNSENDWSVAYNKVYIANVVLENIDNVSSNTANKNEINSIKGQALYTRSYAFFNLAVAFSLPYNPASAESDLGIPLRLTADINEIIKRPSLKETFDKIITDTKEAANLLEDRPLHVLRASKAAAYGLLSRIYLYMKDYENCYKYANLCLQIKNTLISYNYPDIPDLDARFPFSAPSLKYNNPEIIYSSRIDVVFTPILTKAKIDTNLLQSYNPNDNRRKVLFAQGTGANAQYFMFKGSYEGTSAFFDGLATDEVYFMRSEASARLGRLNQALEDLNAVLAKRWDSNSTYEAIETDNISLALEIILLERRKSLIFRGTRWMDLKRLNSEGIEITLTRNIDGTIYTLQPNDLRYAVAIPESIILSSGMPQNPR